MGARTPPRCRRAARRRSRGRGRHAVRARRVSRAAFRSSPFAPAVRDAVRAAIRARVAPPYTGLAGWRPLWRDAREFFGARGRRRAWTSYQVLLCAVRTDWAAHGRKKWAALSSCGLRGLLAGLFARVPWAHSSWGDPRSPKPSWYLARSTWKSAYGPPRGRGAAGAKFPESPRKGPETGPQGCVRTQYQLRRPTPTRNPRSG